MNNILLRTSAHLSLALLFLITGTAAAGLIESVAAKYTAGATVETALSVTTWWKAREKSETSSGHLWLAPGDRFRVEIGGGVWVSDGKTFWQYSPNSSQVVIKNLADVDLSSHPSHLFATYLKNRTYQSTEEKKGVVTMVWQNDSATATCRRIELIINKKETLLEGITVTDRNGNTTTYTFKTTRFSTTPAAGRFSFKPPQGSRILDSR